MDTIAKIVLRDLDILFEGQIFETLISETVRTGAKLLLCLPSNGFNEEIVFCDLDLLFGGKKFKALIFLKGIEMHEMIFVDFNICHRIASLLKFYSETLTYFLEVTLITLKRWS